MFTKTPRVTAGIFKGRKIRIPEGIRPATERFKLKLFDTIVPIIDGARCADIFAGSGSIGIEAISRGAGYVDFVENNAKVVDGLKTNLFMINVNPEQYGIIQRPYKSMLEKNKNSYDIVFADPPFDKIYNFNLAELLILLKVGGYLCLKVPTKREIGTILQNLPESVVDTNAGINRLLIYRKDINHNLEDNVI